MPSDGDLIAYRTLVVTAERGADLVASVREIEGLGTSIADLRVAETEPAGVEIVLQVPRRASRAEIASAVAGCAGVRAVDWA